MKDTTKITLTLGQLKRLVTEATSKSGYIWTMNELRRNPKRGAMTDVRFIEDSEMIFDTIKDAKMDGLEALDTCPDLGVYEILITKPGDPTDDYRFIKGRLVKRYGKIVDFTSAGGTRIFDSLNEAADDSLIEKALEKVMAAGTYKEEDPMICYFTQDATITSFDLDDVRETFEGGEEFEDFNWDDNSEANCAKFCRIVNAIGDEDNLDNCLNTPANLNKLLKKYAEDIIEYGGHSYPEPTGKFKYTPPTCADCGKSLPGDGSGTDKWGGLGPKYVSLGRDSYDEPIKYVCWDCFKKNHKEEYKEYMSEE